MPEGEAELLKIILCQLVKDIPIDVIRREHRCILTKTKSLEPLNKAVHRRPPFLFSSSPLDGGHRCLALPTRQTPLVL
jgi:hypothetical protein